MLLAKRKYFAHKINCCKSNAKLLWRVINDITCRKKQKQGTIPCIKLENGTTAWNQKNIADELNNYFVNIGPKLASKIKPTVNNHNYYLQNSQLNTLFLTPTDPNEVQSIIYNFKLKINKKLSSSNMCQNTS
jgi:hypothetical protein